VCVCVCVCVCVQIDLKVQNCSDLTRDFSPVVVQSQRDHTKYAVSVKWSPQGGDFLVTASHDKIVILYQKEVVPPSAPVEPGSESSHTSMNTSMNTSRTRTRMKMKTRLNLKEIPEDVVFCFLPEDFTSGGEGGAGDCDVEVEDTLQDSNSTQDNTNNSSNTPPPPPGGGGGGLQQQQLHLIVPSRGAPHLLYIHCASLRHRKVSLNEQAWDTHNSFNVLHMSLSPSGKQLLVATDKDFHIILKTGTNKRLSLLAGHMCNDYGKPKTSWDATGKYVFSNNQADHDVLVYEVNTGKIAASLGGHRGQVRDLKSHPSARTLLTASYDHTVREWVGAGGEESGVE
jgi:WD40 repeat protein